MVDLYRPLRYRVPLALTVRGAADAYACNRCGALVMDTTQHSRWHGAVDSNATTLVAGLTHDGIRADKAIHPRTMPWSTPYPCSACALGQHSKHDRDWNTTPGQPGGAYCPCRGNCAEWAQADIHDLIERSSLGTPAAKKIRASVSREQVAKILARVKELEADGER